MIGLISLIAIWYILGWIGVYWVGTDNGYDKIQSGIVVTLWPFMIPILGIGVIARQG